MCDGNDCTLREDCLRYIDEESFTHQNKFTEAPFKNNSCGYFYGVVTSMSITEKEKTSKFILQDGDKLTDGEIHKMTAQWELGNLVGDKRRLLMYYNALVEAKSRIKELVIRIKEYENTTN